MTTSLAAQLQKLAVPQSSLIEQDKKRKSLLFNPKEAASIDRDTFYDIGISGLRDLKALDADFAYFENNLFSSTSKNVERSIQDKDTNQNLNKTIKKFFILLSPYFLLKPAQKTLEWLIQRFCVHEYNKTDFFKLILPYHETNIFVRCLQLFNIKKKTDDWNWLYPLQKSGAHLPKITLYNHCASNVGFLKYVSYMVIEAVEKNSKSNSLTTLFTFYCTTIIGTLENLHEITEPQLTAILPSVLKGLLSDISDYVASSYMITAQLLKKTRLSEKFLNIFVQRISDNSQKHLRTEATLLLLLVYQSQKENFTTISNKALKNLVGANWFVENLKKLSITGSHVMPLFVPVMISVLKKIKNCEYRNFTDILVSEIHLDDASADNLIRIALDNYPLSNNKEHSSVEEESDSDIEMLDLSPSEWYASFLNKLEKLYPNAFDQTLRNLLANKSSTSKRQSHALKQMMKFSMSTTNNKSSYTIFEKLYHPIAHFRFTAIEYLVKNFKNLSTKDEEILQGAINERILDEDYRIVQTILKLQHNDLINLLGENNFIDIAEKLLIKCIQNDTYFKIMPNLLKHVCYGEVSQKPNLLLPILPFLLPMNNSGLEISKIILKSDFIKNYSFLNSIKNMLKNVDESETFCEIIYRNILKTKPDIEIKNSKQGLLNIHKYIICILTAASLPEKNTPELAQKSLNKISGYLTQCKSIGQKFNFAECIRYSRSDYLPLQGILQCVKIIINKTDLNIENGWLNLSNPSVKFAFNVALILIKGCHSVDTKSIRSYSVLFKVFIAKCFSNLKQKIDFFANMFCEPNELINYKNQLRVIKITSCILKQTTESINWTVQFESNIIIPTILIGLIHPQQEIRKVVFEIIERLITIKCKNDSYLSLLFELIKHKEEILLDSEQLPLILYPVLENHNIKNILFNLINEQTPMHINSKLLNVLTFINSDDIFDKTSHIAIQVLKSANNHCEILDLQKSFLVYNVILRFNESTAKSVNINSNAWTFINLALEQDIVCLEYQENKYSCPSVLMLDQINTEVFTNLNTGIQKNILQVLINIATISENPEVVSTVYKIIKKIDLDAKLIIDGLKRMNEIKSNKNVCIQRKLRRTTEIPTVDILDMIEWKRGITTLEFIQDKKKLINADVLLPEVFNILKKCLDFDEQDRVEYPKQLLLSTIVYISDKPECFAAAQRCMNTDLVARCVRASRNPATHRGALSALSRAARLQPQRTLHHAAAAIAFVGSALLRQDDAYSRQLLEDVVDHVVPVLLKEKDKHPAKVSDENSISVSAVLRVFVDVMLDIPEYRRLPLFRKLLTTLGVEDYIWMFLILIFEAHVIHGNEPKPKDAKSRLLAEATVPKRLEIASTVVLSFPPNVVLNTSIKLLEYLKSLPNEVNENRMDVDTELFNIKQRTPKQFRHYKYTLVTFLSNLLSSKQLVNKIATLENDDLLSLEPLYKSMIINILTYIQTVSKLNEKYSNTQGQYWKILLHHCFDIMDSINALLTTEMFLLVIRGLIVHNIITVRRKAMEIFNHKLQHQSTFFYNENEELVDPEGLFALIPSLLNIIKTIDNNDTDPEQELIEQTALLSLKLLTKLLAAQYPDKFIHILNFITDIIKSNKTSGNILASVVLCLAELCSKLRAYAIPGLVRYMPALIKVIKSQSSADTPGLLLMCIITALQKIIESLPLFLSPYLEKILTEVCILSVRWSNIEDNQKIAPFIKKLSAIRSNIGINIPPRILIPIVAQTYDNLLKHKQFVAIGPLMNILSENLSQLRGSELNNHLSDLTTFFLSSLQFRTDFDLLESEIVTTVEDNLIKSLTTLVLKLSETTFRPFYYRLFDWAINNDVKSERVITFYRLSVNFADNLKSLFVLFAGHFIKNVATLLDECNAVKSETLYFENNSKSELLIQSILHTLKLVFTYDSQNFIDKDRFETLMQPIVDQLENIVSNVENLTNRSETILIPCIAQFAVAIADDALWKQLNYQILLKTRHNMPEVRLIALNCILEVGTKLGEDFLPLLPETIPFLAEMLEDEDERVETRCQKVVQDLEKTLGEPLQKYF